MTTPQSPLVGRVAESYIQQHWNTGHRLLAQKERAVEFAQSVPVLASFNPSPARGPFPHECFEFMQALERFVESRKAEKTKLSGRP
jgi:hypothetical protein